MTFLLNLHRLNHVLGLPIVECFLPPPLPPDPWYKQYPWSFALITLGGGVIFTLLIWFFFFSKNSIILKFLLLAKAKKEIRLIRNDLTAPALVPPLMETKELTIDQLPNTIAAHHHGMPATLAAVNMRLLLIESVMQWSGLKVFEDVDRVITTDCIDIPYNQVTDEQWAKTMVLTWRW